MDNKYTILFTQTHSNHIVREHRRTTDHTSGVCTDTTPYIHFYHYIVPQLQHHYQHPFLPLQLYFSCFPPSDGTGNPFIITPGMVIARTNCKAMKPRYSNTDSLLIVMAPSITLLASVLCQRYNDNVCFLV